MGYFVYLYRLSVMLPSGACEAVHIRGHRMTLQSGSSPTYSAEKEFLPATGSATGPLVGNTRRRTFSSRRADEQTSG
eukprot:scaffold70229_cov65-Phaeocystis_antarctica.AAC.2